MSRLAYPFRLTEREPPRSMEVGELLRVIRKHLHPHWTTAGIWCSTQAEQLGEKLLWRDRPGTLFVANTTERVFVMSLPLGTPLPYYPLNATASETEGLWDDENARWRSRVDSPVRGWRGMLSDLVRQGYLRPSRQLSYLIGQDTFALQQAGGVPEWARTFQ